MEKVRDKHKEDITLKNSSANTLQTYLRGKKCCLIIRSTYSMQQSFFTLKVDTHENVTKQRNLQNSRAVMLGGRGESPGPLCGMAQSSSHWDGVEAQVEESEDYLSCLDYLELLPVITTTSTKVKLLSQTE